MKEAGFQSICGWCPLACQSGCEYLHCGTHPNSFGNDFHCMRNFDCFEWAAQSWAQTINLANFLIHMRVEQWSTYAMLHTSSSARWIAPSPSSVFGVFMQIAKWKVNNHFPSARRVEVRVTSIHEAHYALEAFKANSQIFCHILSCSHFRQSPLCFGRVLQDFLLSYSKLNALCDADCSTTAPQTVWTFETNATHGKLRTKGRKFVGAQKFILASPTLRPLFECIHSTAFLFCVHFHYAIPTAGYVGWPRNFVGFSGCEFPFIISITFVRPCA